MDHLEPTPKKSQPLQSGKGNPPTLSDADKWRFTTDASLVRDGRIEAGARFLYLIIKSYVGPSSPLPFPSLATLSSHFGAHRKTVQRHLKTLEEWKLIERLYVKDSGRFHSTHYRLLPHVPSPVPRHHRPKIDLRPPQAQKVPSKRYHTATRISTPADPANVAVSLTETTVPLRLLLPEITDCTGHCGRCHKCLAEGHDRFGCD